MCATGLPCLPGEFRQRRVERTVRGAGNVIILKELEVVCKNARAVEMTKQVG